LRLLTLCGKRSATGLGGALPRGALPLRVAIVVILKGRLLFRFAQGLYTSMSLFVTKKTPVSAESGVHRGRLLNCCARGRRVAKPDLRQGVGVAADQAFKHRDPPPPELRHRRSSPTANRNNFATTLETPDGPPNDQAFAPRFSAKSSLAGPPLQQIANRAFIFNSQLPRHGPSFPPLSAIVSLKDPAPDRPLASTFARSLSQLGR
jgi:hypothetical protein